MKGSRGRKTRYDWNQCKSNTFKVRNCQLSLRTHVFASSTVTSVETGPPVKQKYLQVCETLLVSYNVIAISKPHRTSRIQLRCDIFRTCVLMIQRVIILSDTSSLSLAVGSLIAQNVAKWAVHPHVR